MTPETTHPAGEHLVEELLWVHSVLRRDLNTVRRIAAEVAGGSPGEEVGAAIRTLQTRSPLWQLRINCLTYCRFVHGHHGAEDAMLFPRLRASNPALGPVVDKLEADHRVVSGQLDRVEELSSRLETPAEDQHKDTRADLVTALETLAATLLTHLDLEEKSITPTLRTWTRGLW
jgi:Hemerythrin HHE cation binding domain